MNWAQRFGFRVLVATLICAALGAPLPAFGQPRPRQPGRGGAAQPRNPRGRPAAPPAQSAAPAAPPAQPAPAPAAAPEQPPEIVLTPTEAELARGLPIVKVTLAGNRRVASEDIAGYLQQMRPGKTFTPEGLAKDIREMWDSGYFEDVEVDLNRRDEGVQIRILVRERPNVKTLEFAGNEKLDKDELTEALSAELKTGTILSYSAIRRGIQKLRDKYAEEGYFLAEVSYEVVPLKENQVSIKFTVKEHDPVGVRRITFIGNHNIPDSELREVMLTGASSFLDFGTGSNFRQDAFERDVLVINALYYDRGFLSVQVATPRVMLTPDRTGIEITLAITEGPRYKIRQLRIFEKDEDGKEIEPLGGRRHLREMIRAKPGDYFNRAELVKDLGSVQTLYRDAGYANVEAAPQTELDPEKEEVDIVVPIKRRQLVYFGRIEIKGNTKTRDKVIRREMEIEEQQLFSETRLERSKRRITALGYFERVDLSTEQGDDPQHINVNVEIGEKPTGTFQVGAGFSSIENFIATAQVQQANLFGNGQSLALQAQISGLRQLVDVRFFEPYFLDTKFSVSANVFDQLRIYDQFSQTSAGGSLTFGYPIIAPELRVSLAYTLQRDKVSTSTTSTFLGTASAVSVFQRLPLANLFNDGITSSFRPTVTFDTRDNQLFPAQGVFLQGSVEFASKYIGSENQFVRYRYTGRFYYPVNASKSVVLKANTEAGLVTSPNPTGVPIFARFFLGGILDLRGFPLRSVGPRLPLKGALDPNAAAIQNGANIGGNLMYYQNVELEFPIIDAVQIRGVVFTDLGNAWNLEQLYCNAAPASPYSVTNPCFSAKDLFNVRTSWGFGIRWFSPLGPLRFEWGFPFKRLPYENVSDFQFTIGNFF
ncbi:Outer membrane protein assembly factor YaeT precursor [Minicystis rosea]|nr:Outer membrane protein assembly factor YaeT precursor [Minicystis rosea]